MCTQKWQIDWFQTILPHLIVSWSIFDRILHNYSVNNKLLPMLFTGLSEKSRFFNQSVNGIQSITFSIICISCLLFFLQKTLFKIILPCYFRLLLEVEVEISQLSIIYFRFLYIFKKYLQNFSLHHFLDLFSTI